MKKVSRILLKLAVIGLCFWIILSRIDLHDVYRKLAETSIPFVGLAFLTVLAEPFVLAFKWNLLLREKEINVRIPSLIRLIFTSNFLAVAIPTSVGADALRILMLRDRNHSVTHSASSLIVDRVLAVLAIVILSVVGSALIWNEVPEKRGLYTVLGLAAVIVLMIAVLASRLPTLLVPWFRRFLAGSEGAQPGALRGTLLRVIDEVARIHDSFLSFRRHPSTLLAVLCLNFLIQFLRTAQIHFLFHAIRHPTPLTYEMAFVPMIVLLTLLPISYFGLGIKEGGFLYFFRQVGVPAAACLSVSFITYILIFLALLPGAAFAMTGSFPGFGRNKGSQGMTNEAVP